MRRLLLVLFPAWLVLAACDSAPQPKSAAEAATGAKGVFAWPSPPGWKAETIPFPLEFAPALPYRGVEEVRFAPHFFEPTADTYFSYSFAWVLEDPRPVPPEELAESIRAYFQGLAQAVGSEKHAVYDPSAFSARVEVMDPARDRGVVKMVDAFGDGRGLSLDLEAESSLCGGRRVLLVSLSPHPTKDVGDPVWAGLRAQRATFQCLVH